jgi:hypothetical protein
MSGPVTMVGIAGLVGLVAEWNGNNHATSTKFVIGTIGVAMGISVITDANYNIGRDFALLYLLGVLLVEGQPLFNVLSGIFGQSSTGSVPNNSGLVQTQQTPGGGAGIVIIK